MLPDRWNSLCWAHRETTWGATSCYGDVHNVSGHNIGGVWVSHVFRCGGVWWRYMMQWSIICTPPRFDTYRKYPWGIVMKLWPVQGYKPPALYCCWEVLCGNVFAEVISQKSALLVREALLLTTKWRARDFFPCCLLMFSPLAGRADSVKPFLLWVGKRISAW